MHVCYLVRVVVRERTYKVNLVVVFCLFCSRSLLVITVVALALFFWCCCLLHVCTSRDSPSAVGSIMSESLRAAGVKTMPARKASSRGGFLREETASKALFVMLLIVFVFLRVRTRIETKI